MATRYVTPFQVRFPEDLKALIDDAASANSRSINSEIIARLQASFESLAMPNVSDADLLAEVLRRFPQGRVLVDIKPADAGE